MIYNVNYVFVYLTKSHVLQNLHMLHYCMLRMHLHVQELLQTSILTNTFSSAAISCIKCNRTTMTKGLTFKC